MSYDLLIKNGFIIDGTGNPGFYGDLAVKDGKIVKIAGKIEEQAEKVIDAEGKAVTPGFIDPHVHEELVIFKNNQFDVFLRQGVTSIVNGNCGHSVTPYSADNVLEYMYKNGLASPQAREDHPDWNDFSQYVEVVKEKGPNINMGFLLGHGTIRWSVMNGAKQRKPTPEEAKEIEKLIREGMEQGALGISTGLAYIPSRYAETEELIKAAEVVKEYDGIYASHIRYYIGVLEAVKEAIEIGEKANIRVQVSHLSPAEPEAFDEILAARDRGVEIAVDTIPKSAGHCTRKDKMIQFIMAVNSELFEVGVEGVKEALKDPEGRKKILADTFIFDTPRDQIIIINTDNPEMENKSVKELADERGEDPDELLLDLLADDNEKLTIWLGGMKRHSFPGDAYPDNIINNPLVMVGSDRIFDEDDDPMAWYELFRPGAFPIFFKLYREKGVRIEEIVRRVTSLPAQQFRLSNRGVLTAGMAADIAVIDFDNYTFPTEEEIDYSNPLTMAAGVKDVIVNGKVAMEDGMIKQAKSGEILSRNGSVL